MKLLSIVFSFRNEEGNIEPLVKRISDTMQKIENWKYELIFVNDDSNLNCTEFINQAPSAMECDANIEFNFTFTNVFS